MVAPEVRCALWREHLERFLQPDSALSDEQRAFIRETLPELSALLAAPAPNPTMSAWEQRMSQFFTRQQAHALFASIGAPEPPEGLPMPADFPPQPTA